MTKISLNKLKLSPSKIELPNDPKIWLAILAFCEKNMIRYVVLVMSMLPVISYASEFVVPLLYVVMIALCLVKARGVGIPEIAVLGFTVLAIVGTCIFYPQNAEYIFDSNNFNNTIFPCLRWFIVALIFRPDRENVNLLGKISCVSVLVESIFVIAYMMPRGLLRADDMNRAYQLLPNVLLVFNYAFNDKKFWAWIFSAIGFIYLLALGTRGPILILLVYVIVKLYCVGPDNFWKKILLTVFLFASGLIISNSNLYISILRYVRTMFYQVGLSTRIIDFAVEGNMISYLSGRDEIFSTAFEMIKERPFLGYGVYGDWAVVGWNIHNMYLELLVHFGVILGGAILAWLATLVIRAYRLSRNDGAKDMILIFACFVFIRGFFGGSYLMFGVYFLIGLCIKEIRKAKELRMQFSV